MIRQIFVNLPIRDMARSRAFFEAMVRKAVAAGATTPNPPRDYGFMYQHGFADLDGHLWEVFHMDEAAAPAPT
jgi:predicted lactoylglutathione lyase